MGGPLNIVLVTARTRRPSENESLVAFPPSEPVAPPGVAERHAEGAAADSRAGDA